MIRAVRYPGGKGRSFQQVINLMPPHSTYIEAFVGGGAVLRHKKAAEVSYAIDKDPLVIEELKSRHPGLAEYVQGDALEFLSSRTFSGDEVVYCDPPYLPSTRRKRRIYRFDYSEQDHVALLGLLVALPCRAIVSGYPSELYRESLRGWNTKLVNVATHAGVRQEALWFNFPIPQRLHDARYIGADYRERETINRRLNRLQRRIADLSVHERHRLYEWMGSELAKEGPCHTFDS